MGVNAMAAMNICNVCEAGSIPAASTSYFGA